MSLTVPRDLLDALVAIVGPAHAVTDPELCAPYATDWTGSYAGPTPMVVRPGDTGEVAAVLAACNRAGVPVVPQGGNTGLVAGGVPLHGEVVVSLRRLDSLEPVDVLDAQVTVGAGVTLAQLQAHARAAGLDFPVDLAARDSATVGGMIATNAGGTRVFRHGDMRRQVTGVEAALADGRVVSHLSGLLKDNTGYHLPSLLCGSEGTLAVVTRARVRLEPPLPHRATALLATASVDDAMAVLVHLRTTVPTVDGLELMVGRGVELVCAHLGLPPPFAAPAPVYLLVEVAHATHDPLDDLAASLAEVAALVVAEAVATDGARREHLWRYREAHTESINAIGAPVKLDVTLPLTRLARFADEIPGIVAGVVPAAQVFLFGHAADGNVHVNVVGVDGPTVGVITEVVLREVVARGGSISAEHGIGALKREWLALARSPEEVAVFRAIKAALDPGGVLNPHVLLPSPS